MKEGSEQVSERQSKSCLPRLVIQMPPSLVTVNATLLQKQVHKPAHYIYKGLMHVSIVNNKREQTET